MSFNLYLTNIAKLADANQINKSDLLILFRFVLLQKILFL